MLKPLPSYGRGRDAAAGRFTSLIFGTNLTDVIITGIKQKVAQNFIHSSSFGVGDTFQQTCDMQSKSWNSNSPKYQLLLNKLFV